MIAEALEQVAGVRTQWDEYGSLYLWLEGSYGGQTLLIWLEEKHLEQVLRVLQGLAFKGRMVLVVHALPGWAAPLMRALHWSEAAKVLVVDEGKGIGYRFAGSKEIAEGVWVSWDHPGPARQAHKVAPSGLEFAETRAYVPWQHPWPVPTLAPMAGVSTQLGTITTQPLGTITTQPGPAIGGSLGVLAYGLGQEDLSTNLKLLLQAWRLLEDQ